MEIMDQDQKIMIWAIIIVVGGFVAWWAIATFGIWWEARRVRKMVERRLKSRDMHAYKGFDVDVAERRARRQ